MSEIAQAFYEVCQQATKAEACYLVLMMRSPFYGGPEEGGWWGEDRLLVAYQEFASEELASATKVEVEALAELLTKEAKDAEGEHCLRQMDWLEERGLDSDYLPELDGSEEYFVTVSDTIPQNYYADRHYS